MKTEKECFFCEDAATHEYLLPIRGALQACDKHAEHAKGAVRYLSVVDGCTPDHPKVSGIEEAVDKMVTRYCCDCANMVGGGDCRTTFPRLFHPDRDFIISCEKARLDERFCGLLGRNFKLVDK